MTSFPRSLQNLIEAFQKLLPGVGPKTAERFALSLAKNKNGASHTLAKTLLDMQHAIRSCAECFTFSETSPCPMCSDRSRDATLLCVVAEPQDLLAIERTGEFKGRYHVLGGLLSPISGVTPEDLTIKTLLERVEQGVKEVILAFDAIMDGEATAIHLKKLLAPKGVRVTRLARGLPMGSDLEYADEMTLTDALRGRREI